jgi:hypothetical protein
MALQMQRAFNSKMLIRVTKYSVKEGTYDENNDWVEGKKTASRIFCILKTGNKFSQFEEGIAIHNEVGGIRTSDYRSIYISDKYSLAINDKIGFKGVYYNVLQLSDETIHGYSSFLIEKSKNWKPS